MAAQQRVRSVHAPLPPPALLLVQRPSLKPPRTRGRPGRHWTHNRPRKDSGSLAFCPKQILSAACGLPRSLEREIPCIQVQFSLDFLPASGVHDDDSARVVTTKVRPLVPSQAVFAHAAQGTPPNANRPVQQDRGKLLTGACSRAPVSAAQAASQHQNWGVSSAFWS